MTHTSENQVTATGPSSTGSTHAFSFNTNNYKIYMPHRQKFCNSHSYLYNLKKQDLLLLLLLLNHFSSVQLCVTPQMAAQQAPPSLGFSRQEHWSGLPFPSPMRESEVAQSCWTLSDPMDYSLPGSSVHGIFPGKSTEVGCHRLL